MSKKLAEQNFQTRLKSDLKGQGWKIIKNPSGMGYTILDLFISHPLFGNAYAELKTISSAKCKIPLTALQRKEMRDLQQSGTLAVCLTCVKADDVEYMFLTTNPQEEYVNDKPIAVRAKGTHWNGDAIGRRFDIDRTRLNLWGQRGQSTLHEPNVEGV